MKLGKWQAALVLVVLVMVWPPVAFVAIGLWDLLLMEWGFPKTFRDPQSYAAMALALGAALWLGVVIIRKHLLR